MTKDIVLVAGGGGFIGGHLVGDLVQRGMRVRAVDMKPLDEWYQVVAGRREHGARPVGPRRLQAGGGRRRPGLQPRRRHGRHGLHREQQGPLHALRADQHAHADGRARRGASSASSSRRRPASTPPTSRPPRTSPRSRGGRLPGDARGRLRLGEALQRAHVPPLPRGLRARDARGALPQRLRALRHLRRRPREGARGDLPQGRPGEAERHRTRSRSGATASRRAASCTSTTACTAPSC